MNSTAMHVTDSAGGRIASASPSPAMKAHADASGAEVSKDAVKEAAPVEKSASYDQDDLHNALDKLNERVQQVMREIKFSMDEKSDRVVIKVIDQSTKEIIREIPPEAVIDMAQHLDNFKGVLIKEKA